MNPFLTLCNYLIKFLDARVISSDLIVFRWAWLANCTACLAIFSPKASNILLNSSAALSLTLSAPYFFMILWTDARAISDSEFIAIYSTSVVTSFIKLLCKIDSIKEFILTTKYESFIIRSYYYFQTLPRMQLSWSIIKLYTVDVEVTSRYIDRSLIISHAKTNN